MRIPPGTPIVILTGAGITAERGPATLLVPQLVAELLRA